MILILDVWTASGELVAVLTGRCRWETWSDDAKSRGHHRDAATHYGRGRSEGRPLDEPVSC